MYIGSPEVRVGIYMYGAIKAYSYLILCSILYIHTSYILLYTRNKNNYGGNHIHNYNIINLYIGETITNIYPPTI